jgi:hypothetical protein
VFLAACPSRDGAGPADDADADTEAMALANPEAFARP